MVDQIRLNLISKVAGLYYEDGYTQLEIAKMLNTSHSTISRMLNEAVEMKIVEVTVRHPYSTNTALGKSLQSKFGLKDAYVFEKPSQNHDETIKSLGQLTAYVLDKNLEDKMTLGISLGQAVAATTRAFKPSSYLRCRVVRMQGALDHELMEGTNLAQTLSTQLGGEFVIVPAPMMMKSSEACKIIMQEPSVIETLRIAENADIALIGVGSVDPDHSTTLRNNLITMDELLEMRSAGAVGEIFGKYFDANGNMLDKDYNYRSVSIPLDKLKNYKTVIVSASGIHKVSGLLGLIKGGMINVLVTDSESANQLLQT